jgi:hypothetical protein
VSARAFEGRDVPPFDRTFFRSAEPMTRIGGGSLGGKALGLARIRDLLERETETLRFPGIGLYVPKLVVLATDVFDAFVERNGLRDLATADVTDESIARAFLQAELPVEVAGDLRALVEEVRTPLAVRSSSLLEDALFRPFAGVYETKMVANNQPDADGRYRRLVEAVKLVLASTWFSGARSYVRATAHAITDEKMAVVIQEVVGARHDLRFYPEVSGVGRSWNFFPAKGVSPKDGVVNLALGLGKTIVDGGVSWIYSPSRPQAPPPFGSLRDVLRNTQLTFWAVNMGPAAYDPIAETEFLVECDLAAADYDGTLSHVASTYDPRRDRLVPGTGVPGPRVVDFAPLRLHADAPVTDLVREMLAAGERALDGPVEIELAMAVPRHGFEGTRVGFLQLRPMLVSEAEVEIGDAELASPDLIVGSERVMGNGVLTGIRDVVYVKPAGFEPRSTPQIAGELDRWNRELVGEGRPYLLVGPGRWGSSDPWLGIPVQWGQIAGAKIIVESTLPGMDVEASQGAHFFHNIVGFEVFYLCVGHTERAAGGRGFVDWDWLDRQPAAAETAHLRRLTLDRPLRIEVDGRSGRGGVWRA